MTDPRGEAAERALTQWAKDLKAADLSPPNGLECIAFKAGFGAAQSASGHRATAENAATLLEKWAEQQRSGCRHHPKEFFFHVFDWSAFQESPLF